MTPSPQCSSNATLSYLQGCLNVQSSSPWHIYEVHKSRGHLHCLRCCKQTNKETTKQKKNSAFCFYQPFVPSDPQPVSP